MEKTKCFSRIWVSGYFWVCILYAFIVVSYSGDGNGGDAGPGDGGEW